MSAVDEGGDAACWLDRVCEDCGSLVVAGAHDCSRPVRPVTRVIVGFHQDSAGDWVAELSCLHDQHVRHRPPFQERSWVLTEQTRTARLGTGIDCLPCARAELPDGLIMARTAGPFDASTLPSGLLKEHTVAVGTWGYLRVIEGTIVFSLQTDPPLVKQLRCGDRQAIPPGLRHALTLDGPVLVALDFLIRDDGLRG